MGNFELHYMIALVMRPLPIVQPSLAGMRLTLPFSGARMTTRSFVVRMILSLPNVAAYVDMHMQLAIVPVL